MRLKQWSNELRLAGLDIDARLITEYSDLKSTDELFVVWSPWSLTKTLFYLDSFYRLLPQFRRKVFGYLCCWDALTASFVEINLLVPPTKRQFLGLKRIWLTIRQVDKKEWCSFDLNDPTWAKIEYLRVCNTLSRSHTSGFIGALERHSLFQKQTRYERLLHILSTLPSDIINILSLFLNRPETHHRIFNDRTVYVPI